MDTPVRNINQQSDYKDKLLKLIPGEVVMAYITISPMIPHDDASAKWVSLGVCLLLLSSIPFYLRRTMGVDNKNQIIITMVSFILWIYSLGGPFSMWAEQADVGFHKPYIGSILLILWTGIGPYLVNATPALDKQVEFNYNK